MPHECLIATCAKKVEDRFAICNDHLRILPREISDLIRRGYGVGMTRETASTGLQRALARAENWIMETFGVGFRHLSLVP